MEEEVKIIAGAALEFNDSGRTSTTAMARCIIGALEEEGYEIIKKSHKSIKPRGNSLALGEEGKWYVSFEGDLNTVFFFIKKVDQDSHTPHYLCYGQYIDPITKVKEWMIEVELSIEAYENEIYEVYFTDIIDLLKEWSAINGQSVFKNYTFTEKFGFIATNNDPNESSEEWTVLMDINGKWVLPD